MIMPTTGLQYADCRYTQLDGKIGEMDKKRRVSHISDTGTL